MAENNYQSPQYNGYEDYDEEPIDWAKYIKAAIQNWRKIAIVTFCFAVLSVVIALLQKRDYTVTVTLAPEVQGGAKSSGSLGSIASMFGVNLGSGSSSADALNITMFPEIAKSTPFLTQLFDVELNPMPVLPKDKIEARRVLEGPLPSVKLFDFITHRNEEKGFVTKLKESIFGAPIEDPDYLKYDLSRLTREQSIVLQAMQNMINVSVDKKTAITTVSVSMNDPLMCAQLADTVCRRLREYVYEYRTEKERNNFEYYSALCDSTYQKMVEAQAAYAESMDNNRSVILQKVSVRSQRLEQEASIASQVYQQMVQQRELSRARLQEVKPVFVVVEPATLPQRPTNSRAKTCIIITFLGFALSCAWFVVGAPWVKENLAEFKSLVKNEANKQDNM